MAEFDKKAYWERRKRGERGQGEYKFDDNIEFKANNRAYRRRKAKSIKMKRIKPESDRKGDEMTNHERVVSQRKARGVWNG